MKVLESKYFKVNSPSGVVHIHISHKDKRIEEVFIRTTPVGDEIHSLCVMLGVFISESLKRGLELEKVIQHLNTVKSNKHVLEDGEKIENICNAVAFALKKFKEAIV